MKPILRITDWGILGMWQLEANFAQCLLSGYRQQTGCFLLFLSWFHADNLSLLSARPLWRISLGEAGDGRLSSKQKSKGFDAPPALGDAENATPGEEPPTAAAAPTAAASVDTAAAASETPPTPPLPAGKRASGGWR